MLGKHLLCVRHCTSLLSVIWRYASPVCWTSAVADMVINLLSPWGNTPFTESRGSETWMSSSRYFWTHHSIGACLMLPLTRLQMWGSILLMVQVSGTMSLLTKIQGHSQVQFCLGPQLNCYITSKVALNTTPAESQEVCFLGPGCFLRSLRYINLGCPGGHFSLKEMVIKGHFGTENMRWGFRKTIQTMSAHLSTHLLILC